MYCPTPTKAKFETEEEAMSEIVFLGQRGKLFVYLCDCGAYHFSKEPAKEKKTPGRYF